MTPRPFRKVIQESKQGKPKVDWTYCTGRSGLNLQTGRKNREAAISAKVWGRNENRTPVGAELTF